MKDHKMSLRGRVSLGLAVSAITVLGLSGVASAQTMTPGELQGATVKATFKGGKIAYTKSVTVDSGGTLKIVNETKGMVGPHTFSIVKKGVRPKTRSQYENCFTPGHICVSIAKWLGADPKGGPPKKTEVDVGKKGYDTAGDIKKTGDTNFYAGKSSPKDRIVSAKSGTTLYYMCAIHPEMQGQIIVR